MPLSEEELRLLEQMERALAAEDPKFVSTLQGRTLRRLVRVRIFVAAVAFVGGVAILMAGAMAVDSMPGQLAVGALGFLVMLGSAMVGLAAWRGHRIGDQHDTAAPFAGEERPHRFDVIHGGRAGRTRKPRRPRGHGSFMQRLEQRWQHRRDNGGYS